MTFSNDFIPIQVSFEIYVVVTTSEYKSRDGGLYQKRKAQKETVPLQSIGITAENSFTLLPTSKWFKLYFQHLIYVSLQNIVMFSFSNIFVLYFQVIHLILIVNIFICKFM